MTTFRILSSSQGSSICCGFCGGISTDSHGVEKHYCARCNIYHDDAVEVVRVAGLSLSKAFLCIDCGRKVDGDGWTSHFRCHGCAGEMSKDLAAERLRKTAVELLRQMAADPLLAWLVPRDWPAKGEPADRAPIVDAMMETIRYYYERSIERVWYHAAMWRCPLCKGWFWRHVERCPDCHITRGIAPENNSFDVANPKLIFEYFGPLEGKSDDDSNPPSRFQAGTAG